MAAQATTGLGSITTRTRIMNAHEPSCILAVNGGSSSIRFAVYENGEPLRRLLDGKLDRVGLSGTNLTFKETGKTQATLAPEERCSPVAFLLDWLEAQPAFFDVKAVGHRVVHGMAHSQPERITPALLNELHRMTPYAPEHLPMERGDRGTARCHARRSDPHPRAVHS